MGNEGKGVERMESLLSGGAREREGAMERGDRAELRLGLERGAGWAADGPKRPA